MLSIGRVQTPTLALVVNRQKEIENFVPKTYWELKTKYRDTVFSSQGKSFDTIEDAEKADEPFTILMGDQVEPRRRFIETNAQYAKLDV